MQALRLADIAQYLQAPLSAGGEAVQVLDVCTDTRTLSAQALFVALVGPRFDGHEFIAAARGAGAAAVLVEREGDWPLPYIVVPDTRLALGRIARLVRERSRARVIGVTGSNGKTTVKEMSASILAQVGPTLATQGNLNNEIGVPLTLFRLEPEHAYAVIEMGASAIGDIDYLATIAQPDVGVVTNAGPAHLEGFGSLEGVARGKGEMFAALAPGAAAVVNADDQYAPLWRELAGNRRVLDFGLSKLAAVRAIAPSSDGFTLRTPQGEARVRLPLPGRHNVLNALAAAAAATALDVPLEHIVAGLEAVPTVKGRLARVPAEGGAYVLDDSYNANPNSLRAGLEVLAAEPVARRFLVLGDMAELGADAEALHAAAGDWAREAGVEQLFALGDMARLAAERFGAGGRAFTDKQDLTEALRALLAEDVAVLVKGSRCMAMEQVVAEISARSNEAES